MAFGTVLKESVAVGIILVVVGYILQNYLYNFSLYSASGMATYLFVLGVLVHIINEYAGLNKKYCETGNACDVTA